MPRSYESSYAGSSRHSRRSSSDRGSSYISGGQYTEPTSAGYGSDVGSSASHQQRRGINRQLAFSPGDLEDIPEMRPSSYLPGHANYQQERTYNPYTAIQSSVRRLNDPIENRNYRDAVGYIDRYGLPAAQHESLQDQADEYHLSRLRNEGHTPARDTVARLRVEARHSSDAGSNSSRASRLDSERGSECRSRHSRTSYLEVERQSHSRALVCYGDCSPARRGSSYGEGSVDGRGSNRSIRNGSIASWAEGVGSEDCRSGGWRGDGGQRRHRHRV